MLLARLLSPLRSSKKATSALKKRQPLRSISNFWAHSKNLLFTNPSPSRLVPLGTRRRVQCEHRKQVLLPAIRNQACIRSFFPWTFSLVLLMVKSDEVAGTFEEVGIWLLADFVQGATLSPALLLPLDSTLSSSSSTTLPWGMLLPFSAARILDLAREPLVAASQLGKAA